jgi:hypothetical protein
MNIKYGNSVVRLSLRSLGFLCSLYWQLFTDVSGQPFFPMFKGQAVEEDTAKPRRMKTSSTPCQRPGKLAHLSDWCIALKMFCDRIINLWWAGYRSRYSNCLWAGRSGDRIPVGARFSAPVQTGPEAHPTSCATGTGSFPGVRRGWGVTLTPHPLLVPRSKIE